MSTLVIDAEAVAEFLDKSEPLVSDAEICHWNDVLVQRPAKAEGLLEDERASRLVVPGTARLNEENLSLWATQRARLIPAILSDPQEAIRLLSGESAPPWLWEWATFWLSARWPEDFVWWSRWMFLPQARTGAVALVLSDPDCLVQDSGQLYQQIVQAGHFTDQVVASLHRLTAVDPPYRHLVGLAMVYAVYLFTMTSWKLTEEFTHVLPPFPRVVTSLLAIQRWEGHDVAKSEGH